MKIVTVEEMREIESRTQQEYGYDLKFVQENAGISIVNVLQGKIENFYSKRVLFLIGKGNNGGDALVAARTLYNRGGRVRIILFEENGLLSESVKYNLNILNKMGVEEEYCTNHNMINKLENSLMSCDVVIDGIFGIGFKGEPNEFYSKVFDTVNSFKKFTVAVDVPSGVVSDSGEVVNAIFADLTITFGLPKIGFAFFPARHYIGEVSVANVNFPRDLLYKGKNELLSKEFVKNLLPKRIKDSYKGDYGKVLVFGGSQGFTGASIFACKAALRTGAGLVYIITPKFLNDIYETSLPEVISIPIETNDDNTFLITEKPKIIDAVNKSDAILIGPGLGKTYDKTDILINVLKEAQKPIVVDADAIRILKKIPDFETLLGGNRILTPHYGEFSYITGIDIPTLKSDPIKYAKEFAEKVKSVLVLKGNPTIIATPNGETYISTRGNSGLATGGSGDVLAGMISSYLAQGKSPVEASIISVFLHGFTSEEYSKKYAEESLVPTELINYLPISLKELRK
jgi:hydroxyethylthiazole kinase-like uncharacterized protein yjeF